MMNGETYKNMNNKIDVDTVRGLEKLSLAEAKKLALGMIEKIKIKTASKKAHLLKDLNEAPDSGEISRIMWMTILSGEGLSTLNSGWQKLHAG